MLISARVLQAHRRTISSILTASARGILRVAQLLLAYSVGIYAEPLSPLPYGWSDGRTTGCIWPRTYRSHFGFTSFGYTCASLITLRASLGQY
jgi:hypothetical protein